MKDKIIIIKELFKKGLTPTMIANELGINPKNMHYYIKKYNIEVVNKNRSYHCNDEYFDNIDTENKAYLLGFIIADGYLSEKRRICLNNSIDDISILELFKQEVAPDSKIIMSNKQTGVKFRKKQGTIRITSHHMYKTLTEVYNIIENKTKHDTFKFNMDLIPKNLLHHFIRGFFDGDGSVSFYKTNKTIFFNFSFIFNSKDFAEQIGNIFEELFDIKPVYYKIIGKTCEYYTLRFNYYRNRSRKIKDIFNWLYKDSTICLKRKKVKFNNYLEYRAKITDNTVGQCNA